MIRAGRFLAVGTLALLTAASTANRAEAAMITYTEAVVGSGEFGGVAFTDALIVITGTADTDDIEDFGGVFVVVASTEVSVAGIGAGAFTDVIQVVSNQLNSTGGFGNATLDRFILGNVNSAFETYDLSSSFGPVTGPAAFNAGFSFGTTFGTFRIDGVSGGGAFTATTGVVPEPSSLALCGLAGLGMFSRLRTRWSR